MTGESGETTDNSELNMQARLADYFIDQVSGYADRVAESPFITGDYKRNAAEISIIVQRYRERDDIRSRLLVAEDLCDRIFELVTRGQLDSRSAPADALLEYREPFPDQQDRCPNCNKWPKMLHLVGSSEVCVRCYFQEE
jgi:hypothetical protein